MEDFASCWVRKRITKYAHTVGMLSWLNIGLLSMLRIVRMVRNGTLKMHSKTIELMIIIIMMLSPLIFMQIEAWLMGDTQNSEKDDAKSSAKWEELCKKGLKTGPDTGCHVYKSPIHLLKGGTLTLDNIVATVFIANKRGDNWLWLGGCKECAIQGEYEVMKWSTPKNADKMDWMVDGTVSLFSMMIIKGSVKILDFNMGGWRTNGILYVIVVRLFKNAYWVFSKTFVGYICV